MKHKNSPTLAPERSFIFLRMRELRESRETVNTTREKKKNKKTSGTKVKYTCYNMKGVWS